MMNPMKNSGVEWIGEIPREWEINKLGFLGFLQNGISKSGDEFGFGLPFVSYGDVYNNFQLPNIPSGLVNSTKNDRHLYSVKSGDVFFTRTSETVDEIGIASTSLNDILDATFSGFLIRFRPRQGILEPSFSKYYFRSDIGKLFLVKEMNLVTRASLGQNLLKKYPVLLPPIYEQQAIANFLDEETKKLDDAKDLLEQQLDKLKEYRKSLIWETVTKGLDKTVPMKDSGVEWIGEIPEGWELTRLKYLAKITTGTADSQDQVIEGEFPFYIRSQKPVNIDYFTHDCTAILTAGDGDIGNIWHYVSGKFTAHQRVYIISDFIKLIDSRYLYFYFCEIFKLQPVLFDAKTTVGSLRMSMLTDFEVLIPEIKVQQAIANFLDEKTSIIEEVISNIKAQIEIINKQKKTLIYDYVTGKRRVEL